MQIRQPFFTLKQLVEMTGFSRQHLYNEHARGKLPMRKASGRTVVLAEDLDAWVRTFESIPAPESTAH